VKEQLDPAWIVSRCIVLSAGVFAVPGNEDQVDWSCLSVPGRFTVSVRGVATKIIREVYITQVASRDPASQWTCIGEAN